MLRSILLLGLLVIAFGQSHETQQIQIPEASALLESDEGLFSQVQDLQRNVTEVWTYIHTLRNAVTTHLNHLRQHQVELESTVRRLEQARGQGGSHASHTEDRHSHSGEHHSHSGEHHSHSGEHHSHSGEHHSHGDDHQHSHSGEHQSHSGGRGDDHHHDSHSGGGGDDHHHDSHSGGDDHHHDSHSGGGGGDDHHHDSHSGGGDHHDAHSGAGGGGDDHHHDSHTSEDSHSSHTEVGHQHRDSHDSEGLQQSQQGAGALPEPLVVPSRRPSHHHRSHSSSPSVTANPTMQLMTEQGHHHHHRQPDFNPPSGNIRNLSRIAVTMPKYSEYALYDLAVCNVQPNRAIPEQQQQNVMGQVTLWQKKLGGPLNLHVRLQGFSVGDHHGAHQALQSAQVVQQPDHEEDNEAPPATGHRHGFHVHTSGDLSNGCQSTGPHYNPKAVNHGGPNALVRHVGDLGNIECDEHGIANLFFSDTVASIRGQYSIIGKSMVIHSGEDDYGLGGDEESLKTGNAGTRIACCVVQKVEKIPIRTYKAMKSAIQHPN